MMFRDLRLSAKTFHSQYPWKLRVVYRECLLQAQFDINQGMPETAKDFWEDKQ